MDIIDRSRSPMKKRFKEALPCRCLLAIVSFLCFAGVVPCEGFSSSSADLLQKGEVYYQEGNYGEARKALIKHLDSSPADSSASVAQLLLGFIDVIYNRESQAQERFCQVLQHFPALKLDPLLTSPKILHAFDQALQQCPRQASSDGQGILQKAKEAYQNGNYSEAVSKGKEVHFLQSDDTESSLLVARSYLLMEGAYPAAKEVVRQVLRIAPSNLEARQLMVNILLYKEGKVEEAERRLTLILSQHPDSVSSLYDRGWIALQRKDYSKAVSDFQKALAIDPGFIKAYLKLGEAFEARGRRADAIFEYETALSLTTAALEEASAVHDRVFCRRWLFHGHSALARLYKEVKQPAAAVREQKNLQLLVGESPGIYLETFF